MAGESAWVTRPRKKSVSGDPTDPVPLFLEAELLYKPLCPTVGWSVDWLVGLLVCLSVGVQLAFRAVFSQKYWR